MGGRSGGGLLGGASDFLFGDSGAEAAGNAAMAQQSEARRQYQDISRRISEAQTQFGNRARQSENALNTATVSGLLAADQGIASQEKNLSRQEQLVSQIDPTIIEASQQALRLLRGEQSSTLGPLKAQRDQQRQKLVNSLREQLGPGAETSTAGIQALTRFDSESANIFSGAQQQALGNLGNLSTQFNSTRPDIFREIAGLGSLNQNKYQLGANQANFYSQLGGQEFGNTIAGANALQGIGQQNIQNAGAQYVAQGIRGQQASSFGRSVFGTALGAGLGALGGGGAGAGVGAASGGGATNANSSSQGYWSKNPYE